MAPKNYTAQISVKAHRVAAQSKFKYKLPQLLMNSNNATTGHKLQGMAKDTLIVRSWPYGELFRNWKYTVLSCV